MWPLTMILWLIATVLWAIAVRRRDWFVLMWSVGFTLILILILISHHV